MLILPASTSTHMLAYNYIWGAHRSDFTCMKMCFVSTLSLVCRWQDPRDVLHNTRLFYKKRHFVTGMQQQVHNTFLQWLGELHDAKLFGLYWCKVVIRENLMPAAFKYDLSDFRTKEHCCIGEWKIIADLKCLLAFSSVL